MNFSSPERASDGMENKGPGSEAPSLEHYEPKFLHIKEDLHNLFNIEVTSEVSLRYPWVIDELYTAAKNELMLGTPFGFDYMLEEKLLTVDEIRKRGTTDEMKSKALEILHTFKGPRRIRAKELFVETGILSEPEADQAVEKTA